MAYTNVSNLNKKETSKIRKFFKMAPIRQGHRLCLRCDKKFFSEDLKNLHTCYDCRHYSIKND